MKKFWTIVTSLVLVLCSVCVLAACGKKDQPDTVSKVKLNGAQAFYQTTDSPAFDEMTLTITTSKSGDKTLTKAQFDLTDVSEAASDTEFVLFTDGLYGETAGALTEGSYKFSVYVVSYGQKFENFLTVTVTDDLSNGYDLVKFEEPKFVTTYKARSTDLSETDRSKFYLTASYEVGDDNPFTFKPLVSLVSKETDEIVVPDFFNVVVTVKEGTTTVGSDVYSYSNFGFQFTSAAVGRTFNISVLPADFAEDENGEPVVPATLTVTVRDGYNVSQANVKDIGRMSLVSLSQEDKANGYSGSSNPHGYRYVGSDSENIYYDPITKSTELDGNSFDYWAAQYAEWALTDSHYADVAPVNGIFIHGNIAVTPADLPSAFFISEDEAAHAGVGSNYEDYKHLIGTPRDFTFLYGHYMEEGKPFIFNGNLFKLDFTAIPFGLSNKDKGLTGTGFYYSKNQPQYAAGHTSIFNFIGRGDNSVTTPASLKNVELVGNFVNIDSIQGDDADMKASGSLIGFKSICASATTTNCLMRSCQVGMYAEYNHGENGMALDHCKVFDCYNSGIFTWWGENNSLVHSELRRFGGPAVFVVCGTEDDQSPEALADFIIDDESYVESNVVGDEVWFILNHATQSAALFTGQDGLNAALAPYGVTFVVNGKINMMGLFMEQKGPLSTDQLLYGSMAFGDGLGFELLEVDDYSRIGTYQYLMGQYAAKMGEYQAAIEAGDDETAEVKLEEANALKNQADATFAEISSVTYRLFLQYKAGVVLTNEGTVGLIGMDEDGGFNVIVLGQYNSSTGEIDNSDLTIHGDVLYGFLPTNPSSGSGLLCLALRLTTLQ